MAKRFTDTDRWDDEWFQNLPPMMKLLGCILWDHLDHAGIWKRNQGLVEFKLRAQGRIDWGQVPDLFSGRIFIRGDYWFVPRFLTKQYGDDLNKGDAVKSAVARVHVLGFSMEAFEVVGDPYRRVLGESPDSLGSPTAKATAKAPAQAKAIANAEVKTLFGEFVWLLPREHASLAEKLGHHLPGYLKRLNGYIGQIGEKKAAARYKSHNHVIQNWFQKDIDEGKVHPPKPKPVPMKSHALPPQPEYTQKEKDEMHWRKVDVVDGRCSIAGCEQCARRPEKS